MTGQHTPQTEQGERGEPTGCWWNGDCDHCGADDCIATDKECELFNAIDKMRMQKDKRLQNRYYPNWPPRVHPANKKQEHSDYE